MVWGVSFKYFSEFMGIGVVLVRGRVGGASSLEFLRSGF